MKKNKLFVTVLLLGAAVTASAQTALWDSTFRPANYELKIDQFKSFRNSHKDIIFLGNSIMANTDWAELLNSSKVKNRGISGDTTPGILQRLSEVTEGKPAKIFLLIGINDISRNFPDQLILENYREIVSRIQKESPRTKIYLHTLMPVNHTFEKFRNHYGKDEHILLINEAIRKMGDNRKIFLIDLYPQFLDENNRLIAEFTHDGLHLTSKGYQHWAKILNAGKYL